MKHILNFNEDNLTEEKKKLLETYSLVISSPNSIINTSYEQDGDKFKRITSQTYTNSDLNSKVTITRTYKYPLHHKMYGALASLQTELEDTI